MSQTTENMVAIHSGQGSSWGCMVADNNNSVSTGFTPLTNVTGINKLRLSYKVRNDSANNASENATLRAVFFNYDHLNNNIAVGSASQVSNAVNLTGITGLAYNGGFCENTTPWVDVEFTFVTL